MSLKRTIRRLLLFGLSACSALCCAQSTPFHYFYDDAGELFRVLDANGNLIEYDYDAVGNILQIQRTTVSSGALAIFNVTPLRGSAGTLLTIYGQGFSTLAAGDIVMINGIAATVVSASATELVVMVPNGVTSGQITVTVNGVTVSSGPNLVFVPQPAPLIASLFPDGSVAGTSVPVAVTGSNLIGASFSFLTGATAATLNADAGSASVQVTALNNRGIFPMVATTGAGSSTTAVTPGNHFIVMISPDQANSAGISVLNTADPTLQGSDPSNISDQAMSALVSVLNTAEPSLQGSDPSNITDQAESPMVSALNTADPTQQGSDPTNITDQAESPMVSVLNTADPSLQGSDSTNITDQAMSPFVSVLNEAASINPNNDPTNLTEEADSYIVSVNNTASTSARPGAGSATGRGTGVGVEGGTPASLSIANSASETPLLAGQLLTLNVTAPAEAASVEIVASGVPIERVSKPPYEFAFNASERMAQLNLTVAALSADQSQVAASSLIQPILTDAGTRVSGRVVDQSGKPVAGTKVSVKAMGSFAEYFEDDPVSSTIPDLRSLKPVRRGLESGLNWVNPQGVFGSDPQGTGMSAYVARYRADLLVEEQGVYSFAFSTTGVAQLKLDGQVIVSAVRLPSGPHKLEVVYRKAQEPAALQLLWTPPSGVQSAIPAQDLVAADPSLTTTSSSAGSFAFLGVPAKVGQISVEVQTTDGHIYESTWQNPISGSVIDLGDIVVATPTKSEELK